MKTVGAGAKVLDNKINYPNLTYNEYKFLKEYKYKPFSGEITSKYEDIKTGRYITSTGDNIKEARKYLTDIRVQPLRDIFMTYELLAYLSVRATQIGMKACEIPVTRAYPKIGKTPTKISFFKGNSELLRILFKNMQGAYNPL